MLQGPAALVAVAVVQHLHQQAVPVVLVVVAAELHLAE
jgi:hypothetical protein